MKTPPNEVHIAIDYSLPEIPAPDGHYLRIYAKRKGGRLYLATSPDRESWKDVGHLTPETLHAICYGLGLIEIAEPESEPGGPIDMMEFRRRRVGR